MPVKLDPRTGKWRIGKGPAMYDTKSAANRAYNGYLAKKGKKG